MLLTKDLETLISQRPIGKDTANQYRKAIDCFSNFLGRPAKRTDLREFLINRWLTSLPSTLAPDTRQATMRSDGQRITDCLDSGWV